MAQTLRVPDKMPMDQALALRASEMTALRPMNAAIAQNSRLSNISSTHTHGLEHLMRDALHERNLRIYDTLWADCRLIEPQKFNTWPLISSLLRQDGRRLEIAPGLRPRLPIEGTQFIDVSHSALSQLAARGAHAILGDVASLPFARGAFDLVSALDIIEHLTDDDRALAEISRVTRPGGTVLISTPLHEARWTEFDRFVGHQRRYEPAQLIAKLAKHNLVVLKSGAFGMQPRSSFILDMGVWWLNNHREHAMKIYNRILVPWGLRFQKNLDLMPEVIATDDLDEILLVCRREEG
jgi:SAM-dependent methyltransferase